MLHALQRSSGSFFIYGSRDVVYRLLRYNSGVLRLPGTSTTFSTLVTCARYNSDVRFGPASTLPLPPDAKYAKSCSGIARDTSTQESAPKAPSKIGILSSLREKDTCVNGSGYLSGRENAMAVSAWSAERILTTICAPGPVGIALREWDILEGMRREKATRGWGSIAMDVKEDSVAPW